MTPGASRTRATEAIPSLHDGGDPAAISRWALDSDVTDSWGSNDGTDNTSDGFTADAIRGRAKSFDGTDDWIDTPQVYDTAPTEYTASFWSRQDAVSSGSKRCELSLKGSDYVIMFRENNDGVQYLYQYDDSGSFNTTTASKSGGVWTHWTGTWDGDTLRLYKNGVEADTTPVTSINAGGSFDKTAIGTETASGSPKNYFNGDIDDVRVYSHALSEHEIDELYRWGLKA